MKEKLRKEYLLVRKQIKEKDLKSHIITTKIISLDDYKQSKIIALYNSLKDEVRTEELIDYSLKIGKVVALPRVYKNTLRFYQIKENDTFEKSSFNIYEPLDIKNNYIDKSLIDLIIVPGICFDNSGSRIGFGKGFYDRYLTDDMNTIGICFKEQILEKIPSEKHDIKIKRIITD